MYDLITVCFHHGGQVIDGEYKDGTKEYFDGIDIDHITYWTLKEMVEDVMGYKNMIGLLYKTPDEGLVSAWGDDVCIAMIAEGSRTGEVNVFVTHDFSVETGELNLNGCSKRGVNITYEFKDDFDFGADSGESDEVRIVEMGENNAISKAVEGENGKVIDGETAMHANDEVEAIGDENVETGGTDIQDLGNGIDEVENVVAENVEVEGLGNENDEAQTGGAENIETQDGGDEGIEGQAAIPNNLDSCDRGVQLGGMEGQTAAADNFGIDDPEMDEIIRSIDESVYLSEDEVDGQELEIDEDIQEARRRTQEILMNEAGLRQSTDIGPPMEIDDLVKELEQRRKRKEKGKQPQTEILESDYEYDSEPEELSECDGGQEMNKPRIIRKYPKYNPAIDPRDFDFQIGLRFSSREQFKEAVLEYSIANGFAIKFKKSDSMRVSAVCADGCPWRLWASSKQNEKTWQVKSYINTHSCSRTLKHEIITFKWIADKVGHSLTSGVPLVDIQNLIRREYLVEVTYNQIFRAKQYAIAELEGSYTNQFKQVWDYLGEIRRSNPDSTIQLLTVPPVQAGVNQKFLRLYVCLDALKKGFRAGCRPMISLDGCFLKGCIKGEVLCAVARDANDQMYPVAWAMVEVETYESWAWFLALLLDDIGTRNGCGMTIITDQQKGLERAVAELAPEAEHRLCAVHVLGNLLKKHRGDAYSDGFWKIAKSYTQRKLIFFLERLKHINENAYNDLMKVHPNKWARAYFRDDPSSMCDVVENNMAETFNGWIIRARKLPVLTMFEEIRSDLMMRVRKLREQASKFMGEICPRILARLERNKIFSRNFEVRWNGESQYEVRKNYGTRYVVDLQANTCACREWQLSGIPCPHGVAAMRSMNIQPESKVPHFFKTATQAKIYGFSINPTNGADEWDVKQNLPTIDPPPIRKMPGRPKVTRKRASWEPKSCTKISRRGSVMTCSTCKKTGHNKNSCPTTKTANEARRNPMTASNNGESKKQSAKTRSSGNQHGRQSRNGNPRIDSASTGTNGNQIGSQVPKRVNKKRTRDDNAGFQYEQASGDVGSGRTPNETSLQATSNSTGRAWTVKAALRSSVKRNKPTTINESQASSSVRQSPRLTQKSSSEVPTQESRCLRRKK